MRWVLRVFAGLAVLLLLACVALWFLLPKLNDRQTRGTITLPSLEAPVKVIRDSHGMPYIYAESFNDAMRAHGFVMGQDRLFQIEAIKRVATGRLAEVFGAGSNDVILDLDREARTIGFNRLARKQAKQLSPEARNVISTYLEGLNAYITTHDNTHPMEFGLAGFAPEPWTETDVLAVMFYLGWGSSANFEAELTAHNLIQNIGPERFADIAPMVVNPDDTDTHTDLDTRRAAAPAALRWIGSVPASYAWADEGLRRHGYGGSNNWAISGPKAGQSAAIVTNDPHLDSRILPGPWHPVGIITPEFRVVGVSTGLPGVVVGRNEHIAFGVTNAYADAVDVYIETIDPNDPTRYLEGAQSYPFETVTETIRIKDDAQEAGYREEALSVRLTKRGPVISNLSKVAANTDTIMTVRWASADYMGTELGLDAMMRARSIEDALEAVADVRSISLNFVIGDVTGRIARRASGAAPIRLRGDGMSPFPITDGVDNWAGPIPAIEMPGETDPRSGWTGTANHMTAPADYPYIYTTFASPPYRYRRIKEILSEDDLTVEDVWTAQYDTLNIFARDLSPIYVAALMTSDKPELHEIAELFTAWDYRDDADGIETAIFQDITRHLARLIFEDELGSELTDAYLSNWYVWQQRFDNMVQGGTSPWFDDTGTPEDEVLSDLIQKAARAAIDRLTAEYGENRENWKWGKLNRLRFSGPLRLDGLLGRLTGNRDLAMSGSGETLKRALYPFLEPFDTQWMASLRMTADLNDPDKIRAALPGGVVGRTFHPNLADQTDKWLDNNTQSYWWFSDEAIRENAKTTLALTPSE